MKNNIIDVKRVESNPTEPVTLAQAKAQLIVTYSDDDTLITSLITQCRRVIENYCNVSMVPKVITLTADLFNEWELPYGPVTAVTSVQTRQGTQGSGPATYQAATGLWQTEGEEFLSFIPADCGQDWNTPIANANWRYPYGRNWNENRYRIVYNAGPYAPDDLVLAILAEIAFRYQNRGDGVEIRPTVSAEQGACPDARRLAEPYIRQQWN